MHHLESFKENKQIPVKGELHLPIFRNANSGQNIAIRKILYCNAASNSRKSQVV